MTTPFGCFWLAGDFGRDGLDWAAVSLVDLKIGFMFVKGFLLVKASPFSKILSR